MEMDRKYKPELVVCKSSDVPYHRFLYLDTVRGVLAATNGAMLVEIPVDITRSDVFGYIQAEAIGRARERAEEKHRTKLFIKALKTKLVVGDTSFDRPLMLEKYPDYRLKILSKLPAMSRSIIFGVNLDFIDRLRQALGVDVNKHSSLFFAFDPQGKRNSEGGYEDVIRVFLQTKTKSHEVAVIMPRRWFNNNPNVGKEGFSIRSRR